MGSQHTVQQLEVSLSNSGFPVHKGCIQPVLGQGFVGGANIDIVPVDHKGFGRDHCLARRIPVGGEAHFQGAAETAAGCQLPKQFVSHGIVQPGCQRRGECAHTERDRQQQADQADSSILVHACSLLHQHPLQVSQQRQECSIIHITHTIHQQPEGFSGQLCQRCQQQSGAPLGHFIQ